MKEQDPRPLDTLQDIRRMMQRSSRFISLSGLSGVSAGVTAFAGSILAYRWIRYYHEMNSADEDLFHNLVFRLLMLALVVLAIAVLSAFYFTWRKAKHHHLPLWDLTSRRLVGNMMIPLGAGGLLILAMLQYDEWRFVSPACLIFYGLALVNGSRYTLSDVKYLGLLQIFLGLANTQFPGYGLYFWATGFGLLHIVYGLIMWWKYDKEPASAVKE